MPLKYYEQHKKKTMNRAYKLCGAYFRIVEVYAKSNWAHRNIALVSQRNMAPTEITYGIERERRRDISSRNGQ